MAFQVKIKRARFFLSPFSSEQMLGIGEVLRDSIANRISQGLDVNDNPAPPLKQRQISNSRKGLYWIGAGVRKSYPQYKQLRGGQPIRDWFLTGRTMRSLKVKSVSETRGVIGFIDPVADRRAHINNLRWRQFGVSPNDLRALNAAVLAALKQTPAVKFKRVA